ncbi:hypothetical protein CEXT_273891 [Caerostris extrusa]|uniref:Secreted protein n=1 Tax=Caerostris extrusa TaxID=172846 RepID=A0AAV4NNP9_CAEEX|nr:hypothetical protein CEXT_273891 [Caerostris extrusa]
MTLSLIHLFWVFWWPPTPFKTSYRHSPPLIVTPFLSQHLHNTLPSHLSASIFPTGYKLNPFVRAHAPTSENFLLTRPESACCRLSFSSVNVILVLLPGDPFSFYAKENSAAFPLTPCSGIQRLMGTLVLPSEFRLHRRTGATMRQHTAIVLATAADNK